MALLTPLWMQAVPGDAPINYSASQDRGLSDTLCTVPGVVLDGDLLVSQRAAGANMSVDVAAGSVFIAGGFVAGQGKYLCQSTAVVNVPLSPPPATGSRYDLIAAQVWDKQADGGTTYGWSPVVFANTQSVPPGSSAIPLNVVTVNAGVASITAANLYDARPYASSFSPPYYTSVIQPNTSGTGANAYPANTVVTLGWTGITSSGTRPLWYGGYGYATRMTAPVKGLYDINSVLVVATPSGANGYMDSGFRLNGSAASVIGSQRNYYQALQRLVINSTVLGVPLNVNDYVECIAAGTSVWSQFSDSGGVMPQSSTFSVALRRQVL